MAFTLLKPTGIDLSQTFAFTGSVSGAGGGKVNQVLWSEYTYDTSISSSSFTDLTDGSNIFQIQITPTATTSKILLEYTIQAYVGSGRGYTTQLNKIVGGTTTPLYGPSDPSDIYDRGSGRDSIQSLQTAGTTSQMTFRIKVKTVGGNSVGFSANNSPCIFTAIEILA